jgi:sugar phosphate permease
MEKQKLPNSTAVLVLGILSIPGCCLYGLGLILGIVALVLAGKDTALNATNPDGFDGYSNVKTGKILAIIGIVLSVLYLVFCIAFIVMFGWEAMQNPELMEERMKELMGQ